MENQSKTIDVYIQRISEDLDEIIELENKLKRSKVCYLIQVLDYLFWQ
ncbi:hypothetical protein [Gottfriedia acidiceleris]|nr:hypothetical protein [Gottfriedia acidiceleris]